jgi:hypothetical protein
MLNWNIDRRAGIRRRLAPWGAFAIVAVSGCHPHSATLAGRAADEWTRTYDMAPGGEFQIVAGNGSVDVRGGPGERIEVRAERIARAETDAAASDILPRIRIREDIAPNKVVLQTEGLSGIVIGVEVQVNYHVTMPAALRLRARSSNGSITIADMEAPVVASSSNGAIACTNHRGGVDVRAVNGDVTIDLAAFDKDPVDLRSTNGRVDLALPADAAGTLSATCVNGKIDVTDVPFEPFGEQSQRRVRGRFNAGGTPIDISAVNGSIRVHSRP